MHRFLIALAACSPAVRVYELDELPVEEWTAGLPVRGDGTLVVALPRPGDWSRAAGIVAFSCDGCTLGDDRTKATLPYFGRVDFGHLTFTTAQAHVTFRDGRVRFVAQLRSPDVTFDADVDGVLAARAEHTELAGCIRFAVHDTLLERDPRTHALLSVTGAPRVDGHYYIRVRGTVGAMRLLGEVCTL